MKWHKRGWGAVSALVCAACLTGCGVMHTTAQGLAHSTHGAFHVGAHCTVAKNILDPSFYRPSHY